MASEQIRSIRGMGRNAWGWLAVSGTLSIVLGLVSLFVPGATVTVLAIVFSVWLLASGAGRIALARAMDSWVGWRRLTQTALGLVLVVAGVAGLFGAWNSLQLLTLLVGLGFLLAAVADLVVAATAPSAAGRFATGSLGVVHLLVALVFLFLPEVGLTVLAVIVGLVLLGLGLMQLLAALLIRAVVRRAGDLAERLERTERDEGPEGPRVIRGEVL